MADDRDPQGSPKKIWAVDDWGSESHSNWTEIRKVDSDPKGDPKKIRSGTLGHPKGICKEFDLNPKVIFEGNPKLNPEGLDRGSEKN